MTGTAGETMGSTQVNTNGNKAGNAKSNGDLHSRGVETASEASIDGGKLIVLPAPLTETIDHAGYFIQMGMAWMPIWMEGVFNRKYPNWRNVEYTPDGSARYMPAGVRVLEKALLRYYSPDDIAACYPDDLER